MTIIYQGLGCVWCKDTLCSSTKGTTWKCLIHCHVGNGSWNHVGETGGFPSWSPTWYTACACLCWWGGPWFSSPKRNNILDLMRCRLSCRLGINTECWGSLTVLVQSSFSVVSCSFTWDLGHCRPMFQVIKADKWHSGASVFLVLHRFLRVWLWVHAAQD